MAHTPKIFTVLLQKTSANPWIRLCASKMVHSRGYWWSVTFLVMWASPLAAWVLVCNLRNPPGDWPPSMEGKERPKKGEDHSRLLGGSFNKQKKLHTRLVLGGCKTCRCLHPPTKTVKVNIKAFTGFGHRHKTWLPQGCVLETAPSVGMVGRTYTPRMKEGWGASTAYVHVRGQPAVMSFGWPT